MQTHGKTCEMPEEPTSDNEVSRTMKFEEERLIDLERAKSTVAARPPEIDLFQRCLV